MKMHVLGDDLNEEIDTGVYLYNIGCNDFHIVTGHTKAEFYVEGNNDREHLKVQCKVGRNDVISYLPDKNNHAINFGANIMTA